MVDPNDCFSGVRPPLHATWWSSPWARGSTGTLPVSSGATQFPHPRDQRSPQRHHPLCGARISGGLRIEREIMFIRKPVRHLIRTGFLHSLTASASASAAPLITRCFEQSVSQLSPLHGSPSLFRSRTALFHNSKAAGTTPPYR